MINIRYDSDKYAEVEEYLNAHKPVKNKSKHMILISLNVC